MPLQVLLLAIVAMIGLATLRLVRVHRGRTPLPERIAADRRLGLGVASTAATTALDARSRLDTLRGIALRRGAAAGAA
jgi:hypothetical protein